MLSLEKKEHGIEPTGLSAIQRMEHAIWAHHNSPIRFGSDQRKEELVLPLDTRNKAPYCTHLIRYSPNSL